MSLIWSCPDCDADLEDDGWGDLWCGCCKTMHALAAFADPDNDRDLMIDDKDRADVA